MHLTTLLLALTLAQQPSLFDPYDGLRMFHVKRNGSFHVQSLGLIPALFTPEGNLYLGRTKPASGKSPYIIVINIKDAPGLPLGSGPLDLYAPRVREAISRLAQQVTITRKTDPWLIGYQVNLRGKRIIEDHRQPSLLWEYLQFPDDSPGHSRAEEFLNEVGDTDATLTDREETLFQARLEQELFDFCAASIRQFDQHHLIWRAASQGNPPPLSKPTHIHR
jgi:hypothetical protein